jgi:uncharacterized membrane protein YidH (DUF202 family)
MSLAVALFGLFIAGLGAAGMLSPRQLLELVTRGQASLGPFGIAALRLGMSVAMLGAADQSRVPLYLRGMGVLALISALATPFVGARRFAAVIDWWRRRSAATVRLWSLVVLGFGISMVWAVLPIPR